MTPARTRLQWCGTPITVFDVKGVPGHRREHIEAAVVAGGKHASTPYEAWIAADPFKGGFRLLITGPHGFERTAIFGIDDEPLSQIVSAKRWKSKAAWEMSASERDASGQP